MVQSRQSPQIFLSEEEYLLKLLLKLIKQVKYVPTTKTISTQTDTVDTCNVTIQTAKEKPSNYCIIIC